MNGVSKKKNKFLMLLKNDFLASSRVISFFYIASAILFAVYGICTAIGKIESISPELLDKVSGVRTGSVIFIFVVSFLLIFVTLFFVIFDFFKSLFGAQGYLSFTLPVSSYELLGSKVIVYGGWFILSCGLCMYSFFFFMDYISSVVIGAGYISLAEELMTGILNLPSLKQFFAVAVYCIVLFFVIILNFIFISYFSISVAHVRQLQKFSLLASVPIFIVISLFFLYISFKMSDWIDFSMILKDDYTFYFGLVDPDKMLPAAYLPLQITPIFMFIILDAVMFVLAAYVMHKKVNLK